MISNRLANFDTTDDKQNVSSSLNGTEKFLRTKRKIKAICTSLTIPTNEYEPSKTAENISQYIKGKNKLDRILYSEISAFLYGIDSNQRGIFTTNIEHLLLYTLDDNNHVNDDCRKIVIKIYDHLNLVLRQVENISKVFQDGIVDTKELLRSEITDIQKEYIGILGIFSSVVLAFTGGIAFSTSVLQNIHLASPYRIFAAIILVGFVFINIIYLLFHYIDKIVHGNTHKRHWYIIVVDFVLAALLFGVGVSWYFDFFDEKSSYPEGIQQIEEQIEEELRDVLKSKVNVSITIGDQPQEQVPAQDPYVETREFDDVMTEAK